MRVCVWLVVASSLALLAASAKTHHGKWTCKHATSSLDLVRHVRLDGPRYEHIRKRAIDQQFRIFVHYDTSVSALQQTFQDRLKFVINNLTQFYETTVRVRTTNGPILLDRSCTGNTIFPPGKRCSTTCATTTCGEVTVPADHLKACVECNGDPNTCQSTSSNGTGVNADFILYVSAVSTAQCSGNTIAYAGACQMEDMFDRPIAGHANFCPAKISDADSTDEFIQDIAKHELLHALAFSASLYPFWRNPDGTPRTERNENGDPVNKTSSGFVASSNTLRTVTYDNWQTRNGPIPHTVTQLVTPRIVEEARVHFNCSTLTGVEVENQGGSGTSLSHWEKRILEPELMTGVVAMNPTLSRLTLALLEDSGWYSVDYSKAQQLLWGRNSGCDLPAGSCGGYIQNRLTSGRSLTPFCNRLSISSLPPQQRSCTLDRTAVSQCNLQQLERSLETEYQYFNSGENFDSTTADVVLSRLGSTSTLTDYCPLQQGFSNGVCTDTSSLPPGTNGFAETYGVGSRCVLHGGEWTAGLIKVSPFGAGCYQYSCLNNQVSLFVLGNRFDCSRAGEVINVDVTDSNVRYQGSLVCPSCLEICYDDFANCDAAAQIYSQFNNTRPPPGFVTPSPDKTGSGSADGSVPTPSPSGSTEATTRPSAAISRTHLLFGPFLLMTLGLLMLCVL